MPDYDETPSIAELCKQLLMQLNIMTPAHATSHVTTLQTSGRIVSAYFQLYDRYYKHLPPPLQDHFLPWYYPDLQPVVPQPLVSSSTPIAPNGEGSSRHVFILDRFFAPSEDGGRFICKECYEPVKRLYDCKRHLLSVHGNQKFSCECGKVYTRLDSFRRHRRRTDDHNQGHNSERRVNRRSATL